MTNSCVIAYVTVPNEKEAESLSDLLLKERSVACVNVIPKIRSKYWWEGKIQTDTEFLLMLKTTKEKMADVIQSVRTNHSYDIPEVICLPILSGNPDYLEWIHSSTQNKQPNKRD